MSNILFEGRLIKQMYFKEHRYQGRLNEEQLLDEMKSNKRSFLGISIKNSPLYDDVMEKLNILIKDLDKTIYNETDDEKTKKDKLVSRIVEIQLRYAHLLESCKRYLNERRGKRWTSSGEERRSLIGKIYAQASYEFNSWRERNINETVELYTSFSEMTFREILKDLRTEVIDITGREDIENFGGNTSSGVSIGYGENKRFFKPEESISERASGIRLMQYLICSFSENSKERKTFEYVLLANYRSSWFSKEFANLFMDKVIINDSGVTLDNVKSVLGALKVQYAIDEENNIIIDGFKLTPESLYRLSCIIMEYRKQVIKYVTIDMSGLWKTYEYYNSEVKNIATSRLFATLGEKDLVVKSRFAILREEGVPDREGIIMSKAKGKSLQQLSEDLKFYDAQSMNGRGVNKICLSKDVQRKFANLQLGDYIADQVDRNLGNCFVDYEFHYPEVGLDTCEVHITSIQGINNDLSFQSIDYPAMLNKSRTSLPAFNQNGLSLPFIDKNFVDKLESLNKSTIKYIFADLLYPKELETFMKRVEYIKQIIAENYNDNQKLDRNGWNQASLDATLASDNYLSRFINYVSGNLTGRDILVVSN